MKKAKTATMMYNKAHVRSSATFASCTAPTTSTSASASHPAYVVYVAVLVIRL